METCARQPYSKHCFLAYDGWRCFRRKAYDQTGSLEDSEELAGEKFDNLYQYYRNVYKTVTKEDIAEVEEGYRGTEEEKGDVLRFYDRFKGNMDKVCILILLLDQWGFTKLNYCLPIKNVLRYRTLMVFKRIAWRQY